LQVAGQPWRAIRGLNGIVGWVPNAQVAVDGEAPPAAVGGAAATAQSGGARPPSGSNQGNASIAARLATATPGPILVGISPTELATSERLKVANTDGVGVVLRNSPRDTDRSPTGLAEGAVVIVVGRSGADWVHVRTDRGQDGWVPTQYVVPTP
jgi:SH3-like domain-containing protein